MLDLELRPGVGLGLFELGASLWTVLDLLRENTTRFPHVDVKFDQQQPVLSPIILHIRPHIDLLFSPRSQRLHTISARRLRQAPNNAMPTILTLRYALSLHDASETVVLSSPTTVLRRADVNKVFGPTYSGDVLSFPGVWFAFDEESSAPLPSPPSKPSSPPLAAQGHALDRNAEVKRVVICQRSKEVIDGLGEVTECAAMEGELKSVVIEPRVGVKLTFHSTLDPPPPSIWITIGQTTSQDLICDLGSPLRTFYKEDDRMTIHSAKGPQEPDDGYFYNYFQHGMDILLSGTTHKVKKIILHSNVPGSLMFQRYKRCPWEIVGSTHSGSPKAVSIGERVDKVQRILTPSTSAEPPSMVLDRTADSPSAPTLPMGVTKLLGFDGVVLEVTEVGDILTVMMF
ncbi:UPF0183-domain-containing protein [Clavulina sp. PMI_390]|nr:UPF0183-domain-containing protein [Clavulina sp. PMI_390]